MNGEEKYRFRIERGKNLVYFLPFLKTPLKRRKSFEEGDDGFKVSDLNWNGRREK